MQQRLVVTRRAALFGAIAGLTAAESHAGPRAPQPLFVIARSKNANVVHYAARVTESGGIDPDEPLSAYWVLHAEDGRREGLTWLERRLAYGWTIRPDPTRDGVRLRLHAFPHREISVRRGASERYHAYVSIAGQTAALERIFVSAEDGLITPSVRYVDLFGLAVTKNRRVSERLLP